MIINSFKKCGITTNVDDSENTQVSIWGLKDYVANTYTRGRVSFRNLIKCKSEHEYRVINSNDNGNNNCTTDFEGNSFSGDENED